MAEPELRFAGLLRQLRAEARLTQEELAEVTGLSPRTISDLERGVSRAAHKDTGVLLADALGVPGPVHELFVAAARGKSPAGEVLAARQEGATAAATRALPRDIAAFTGRQAELAQLLGTLAAAAAAGGGVVGIHAIDGMAGIGKTTFAVHTAHRLADTFPDGQFFLPLHAHTPGQRPVRPADALASLLLTAGVAAGQIPPGQDARAARWRDQVAGKKILLLLDDAASHEQVRPLLPGTAGSVVLVTSRRRLTALHGASVISLGAFSPAEAATLFVRLAPRPGLHASEPAVGEITRLCGYLPLAIGMLAGQLRHHPAWGCADMAAELAAARDRLALMRAENLTVAAAFGLSYQDLPPGPQRLFRRLGLVPGPSFDDYTAAALDGASLSQTRRVLSELYDQHLITETARGRYRLHDLLREHARALAAGDPLESDAATRRLLDYYAHTAQAAGRYIIFWSAARGRPPLPGNPPAAAPALSTRQQAVAWLETERPNLRAAVSCAATTGRPLHAVAIAAAMGGFLRAHGPWDQAAASHQIALTAARQAADRRAEAGALEELGAAQWLAGSHRAAATSLTQAVRLYGDIGDRLGQAFAVCHLGLVQEVTGDYPAAAASHQQARALAHEAGDPLAEAGALTDLGAVQRLTGDYPAAASQRQALDLCRGLSDQPGQAWAFNELGILQRLSGDYPAAATSQQQALQLFRDLDERLGQAHALNELGMIQQLTGDYPAAAARHQQALERYRYFGYRLGEAETLNSLGELASRTAATSQARDQHTQALTIARDIGAPLEEARALEGIGRSHLDDDNLEEGGTNLRQALTIYRRIGAPDGLRVQETLHHHRLTSSTAPGPR